MHQTFYLVLLVFAYLSMKSFHHCCCCCCRSSMQLANRLDIQLRSVVEWQELFHPDAILLRQRYIDFSKSLLSYYAVCEMSFCTGYRGRSVLRTVHPCLVIGRISFHQFLPTSSQRVKNIFLLTLDNTQTRYFDFITCITCSCEVC